MTATPLQYLDKAMNQLHDLGLVPEGEIEEAPIIALLEQISDLDEGRVTEKLAWSADGTSLLLLRREITDTGYDLNFNQVNVYNNLILPGGFSLKTEQYLTIGRLFLLDQ